MAGFWSEKSKKSSLAGRQHEKSKFQVEIFCRLLRDFDFLPRNLALKRRKTFFRLFGARFRLFATKSRHEISPLEDEILFSVSLYGICFRVHKTTVLHEKLNLLFLNSPCKFIKGYSFSTTISNIVY